MDVHDSQSTDFKVLVWFSVLILLLTAIAMVLEKWEGRPPLESVWYGLGSTAVIEEGEQTRDGS